MFLTGQPGNRSSQGIGAGGMFLIRTVETGSRVFGGEGNRGAAFVSGGGSETVSSRVVEWNGRHMLFWWGED